MPRVICTLPNASSEISGVKFFPLDQGGLISDEISDEQAERFARIPGYELDEEEREPVKKEAPKAPTLTKAQQKAAAAKAKEAEPAAPVEPPAAETTEEVF